MRTFLRESIESVGCGVGGEEVAAFHFLLVEASALSTDGGFDAVAFADEEVPAENLGEAVHHVVELVVLHVHKRAHRKTELRYLRRRVVSDSVGLEELLQASNLPRCSCWVVDCCRSWWWSHRVVEEWGA